MTDQPTPARPVRVVLVDDHRMFRSGVKAELDPAVTEVVGEAPDVDTAVAVIKETRPDVVLLDVHLPGGNGNGGVDVLSATRGRMRQLRRVPPAPRGLRGRRHARSDALSGLE